MLAAEDSFGTQPTGVAYLSMGPLASPASFDKNLPVPDGPARRQGAVASGADAGASVIQGMGTPDAT